MLLLFVKVIVVEVVMVMGILEVVVFIVAMFCMETRKRIRRVVKRVAVTLLLLGHMAS